MNIIKTAGQSRATYGAAKDPFTQAEIKSLRTNFFEALWPKKYMCCKATGLMLADRRIGSQIAHYQTRYWSIGLDKSKEASRKTKVYERWDQYAVYTGIPRGPIHYFRREIKELGWVDNTPTNITDHNGITREISEWPSL
eukprot:4803888-Heterocapsa_arctica.AAC.1